MENMSPAKKVYEQFKYLDKLLCDKDWVGESTHFHRMCYEFWQAIKAQVEYEKNPQINTNSAKL